MLSEMTLVLGLPTFLLGMVRFPWLSLEMKKAENIDLIKIFRIFWAALDMLETLLDGGELLGDVVD